MKKAVTASHEKQKEAPGRRSRVKESAAPKRKKKGGALIPLMVAAGILLLIVGGSLIAGYSISRSPLILPNVCVGSVNLGGLDAKQATEQLRQSWQARAETPLTVSSIGGTECSIDPVKSGLTLSVEAAV